MTAPRPSPPKRSRAWMSGARGGDAFVSAALGERLSLRLRLVSGFLQLVGGVILWRFLTTVAGIDLPEVRDVFRNHPVATVTSVVAAMALIITGARLRMRERTAGVSAMVALFVPLTQSLAARHVSVPGILLAAIGGGMLASVWHELEQPGRRVRRLPTGPQSGTVLLCESR